MNILQIFEWAPGSAFARIFPQACRGLLVRSPKPTDHQYITAQQLHEPVASSYKKHTQRVFDLVVHAPGHSGCDSSSDGSKSHGSERGRAYIGHVHGALEATG